MRACVQSRQAHGPTITVTDNNRRERCALRCTFFQRWFMCTLRTRHKALVNCSCRAASRPNVYTTPVNICISRYMFVCVCLCLCALRASSRGKCMLFASSAGAGRASAEGGELSENCDDDDDDEDGVVMCWRSVDRRLACQNHKPQTYTGRLRGITSTKSPLCPPSSHGRTSCTCAHICASRNNRNVHEFSSVRAM